MLYYLIFFWYAEFAIRNHGEDAVLQSIETFDDVFEDQLSDSQTSSQTQTSLNRKNSDSETNSKKCRPAIYKKSETKRLNCRKQILLKRAKRAALLKYSSMRYHANDKILCMLCPKDDALSMVTRNLRRHCCMMHADFITYRSQMVGYMLCIIFILLFYLHRCLANLLHQRNFRLR